MLTVFYFNIEYCYHNKKLVFNILIFLNFLFWGQQNFWVLILGVVTLYGLKSVMLYWSASVLMEPHQLLFSVFWHWNLDLLISFC